MYPKISKKSIFSKKCDYLFSKFRSIIVVEIENIGSVQLQKCRKALGETSVLLIGKNTSLKKVFQKNSEKDSLARKIVPFLAGNIGLIFTNDEIYNIKEILSKNSIPAPAKNGQIAQCDVIVPPGPTNITPDGTSFFQALNIPTKILKGQIEIQNEIKICSKGECIGESEVSLLNKLGIVPFTYQLQIKIIFDKGICYYPSVFDLDSITVEESVKTIINEMGQFLTPLRYVCDETTTFAIKQLYSTLIFLGYSNRYSVFLKKLVYSDKPNINYTNDSPEKEIYSDRSGKSVSSSESEEESLGLDLFS